MLEAVRSNKRVAQVILAILIVPFAFFGMESYFQDGPAGNEVATVGGSKILTQDFDQAMREQQDRLRESMGGEVDRAMLESPELRKAVLENLVNQRLLAVHAANERLMVTQEQLQKVIAEVPAFQEDGKFSLERYESLVRAQGMTPAVFESRLGQDLRTQQIAQAVGDSAFVADASARRFLMAQLEEREVSEMRFSPAALVGDVTLADGAAKAFYDANQTAFERPARLRAEYLVFDEASVMKQVTVPDEEVRKFYDENADRFSQPEERSVRHILVAVAADADADAKSKARAKADDLLAQLRQDPTRFAELAQANSDDPGSATRGGDLGFFGRGAMVKPFEDAAYALGKGEISGVVTSDFGLHIIKVDDIRAPKSRPFEMVKDEIAEELKSANASRRFAELAEQFSNLVYEQADSLKPAAEALKLEIRQSDWITRDGGAIGGYDNEKLRNALFSDDAGKHNRNVEAVEVARGTLVSARVLDSEPAQTLPFDTVKAQIEQQLRSQEAAKLAKARGEAVLASLAKGEAVSGTWSGATKMQRGNPELSPALVDAAFGVKASTLPAHVGAALPDGTYVAMRVEKVIRPELAKDDPRVKAVAQQYERLMAERDFSALMASLRERYKVEINSSVLTPKEQ